MQKNDIERIIQLPTASKLKKMEEFIDGFPLFGIKAIPHQDAHRLVDGRQGMEIVDPAGREWSADRYYILDRTTTGSKLDDAVRKNQCGVSKTINGITYLLKLANTLRSAYEHAVANQYATKGVSFLIIDRSKALPSVRKTVVESGEELREWRGRGEDYCRPDKPPEGVLDQGAIAKQGQVIPFKAIVGNVYKGYRMRFWQCILPIYGAIYKYMNQGETSLPAGFDEILLRSRRKALSELRKLQGGGGHLPTSVFMPPIINALVFLGSQVVGYHDAESGAAKELERV